MVAIAKCLKKRIAVGLRASQGVERRHRDKIEGDARGMPAWEMTLEPDLCGIEPECPGAFGGFPPGAPGLGEFRQLKPRAAVSLIDNFNRARNDADLLLEAESRRPWLPVLIENGEKNGRADSRMTGERQFSLDREDANIGALPRVLRWQNEHCLGQIEFARDRLHGLGIEALGIQHDRQRISRQRVGRENIQCNEVTDIGSNLLGGKRRVGDTNSSCAATVRISREPVRGAPEQPEN